jgi:hypothetical protein
MLVENVQRAMQATPVKNKKGEAIGEFRYNDAVANKSLELLARILGMLVDKSEITVKKDYSDLSDLELLQLVAKEARGLELIEYQGKVVDAEAVDKAND